MKKIILSPSLLSVDFAHIADDVKVIDEAGAQYIHLDVMDGMFVPNISFGQPIVKAIRNVTTKTLDVHLMIEEPDRYVEDFKAAGADMLTVHAEACKHLHRTISHIKEAGMKAGVALNPATPLDALDYVLDMVDMVLIMTVNPGFGGQSFIPSSYAKVASMKRMIGDRGLDTDIQVDGGITLQNIDKVINAGANIIVAGSAVFKGDKKKNVKAFLEKFKEHESE